MYAPIAYNCTFMDGSKNMPIRLGFVFVIKQIVDKAVRLIQTNKRESLTHKHTCSHKTDTSGNAYIYTMNGCNHELPKWSVLMCSGNSEHFLWHMAPVTIHFTYKWYECATSNQLRLLVLGTQSNICPREY